MFLCLKFKTSIYFRFISQPLRVRENFGTSLRKIATLRVIASSFYISNLCGKILRKIFPVAGSVIKDHRKSLNALLDGSKDFSVSI